MLTNMVSALFWWMQGEADALFKTPAAFYRDNLQLLINRLSTETNKRITWVIARTSRTSPPNTTVSNVNPTIIAAQNAVLATPFNPTYPGPETDNLVPNRGDGTHFVGANPQDVEGTVRALTVPGQPAWNDALSPQFFSTVTPSAPTEVPVITATCVAEE